MSSGMITRASALLVVGLALVGCDSIRGQQETITPRASEVASANEYLNTKKVLDTFYGEENLEKRRDHRDKVIGYRMIAINAEYYYFVGELREGRVVTGLGADILNVLLGLGGAVVGGAQTKAALAAGSTAVIGAKGSIDKNVFYDKTVAALIAQMEAQRTKVLVTIRESMNKNATEYPLPFALDDLSRLERAGSIETAFAEITKKAQKEADEEAQTLKEVTVNYTPSESVFKTQNRARYDKLEEKIRAEKDAKVLTNILANFDLPRGSERERIAKDMEKAFPGKTRSDPDIARKIIVRWIEDARNETELSYWEKLIGS